MRGPTISGFNAWMKEVDEITQLRIGLSIHDLEDCCFADWYDDGLSSAEVSRLAIQNAGGE